MLKRDKTVTCAVSAWTSKLGSNMIQDTKTEATGSVTVQSQGQAEEVMPNVVEGTARAGPGLLG